MTAGITLSGFSSGIDTATIVAQLMAVERQPVARLEAKNEERQLRLTYYSDLRTKMSSLKSAVDSLNSIREFNRFSATSSDEDDEHFTVATDSSAQATTHTIQVLNLAVAEKEISQGYAETSSEIGTGTFSITVAGEETEVEITASNNTLEGLRDAINNSDAAVTASIMNDGDASNPYRLVITSDETGTDNAITLDTSGMSGGTTPVFTDGSGGTPGQQAEDASFTFDGVTITSSSNEVEDVVTGIDINLKKVDDENEYTITIESNIEDIMEDLNSFVEKYNDLMSYIEGKQSDTTIERDYTFSQVRRAMQNIVYESYDNGGEYTALSQVGFSTNDDGSLSLDEDELEDLLETNYDDVMRLMTAYGSTTNSNVRFVNSTADTEEGTYAVEITGVGASLAGTIGGYETTVIGENILVGAAGTPIEGLTVYFSGSSIGSYGDISYSAGVMQQFYEVIDLYTDSTDGLLKSKEDALNDAIDYTQSQIDRKELALDKTEARLNAQFTAMELAISQLQTQSSYLSVLGTGSLL